MSSGLCDRTGCKEIGTHKVWVEFYPPSGMGYEGAPAQLFFPDLVFCEAHAMELRYQDLVVEEQVAGLFHQLGRITPDFTRSQVKTSVVQGQETV